MQTGEAFESLRRNHHIQNSRKITRRMQGSCCRERRMRESKILQRTRPSANEYLRIGKISCISLKSYTQRGKQFLDLEHPPKEMSSCSSAISQSRIFPVLRRGTKISSDVSHRDPRSRSSL